MSCHGMHLRKHFTFLLLAIQLLGSFSLPWYSVSLGEGDTGVLFNAEHSTVTCFEDLN